MQDLIIIGVIAVLVVVGIVAGRKHFKGEGGCCGGSKPIPRQNKKLEKVVAQKTVVIEGMKCEHCQNWVEKSINEIEGVAARVDLKKKEAVVSLANTEITDDMIRRAVEKVGYKVVDIR